MDNLLSVSIVRTGDDWRTKDAATLATEIEAAAAFEPCDLNTFQREAVGAGALIAELRSVQDLAVWPGWMTRFETNLREGDLADIQALWDLRPAGFDTPLTTATRDAIQAAIGGRTLRLVDIVAGELGEEAPASVTDADITAALNDAGYTWDVGTATWWIAPDVRATGLSVDVEADSTLTIDCDPFAHATAYEVEISDVNDFSNLVQSYSKADVPFTTVETFVAGEYFARVRYANPAGSGKWSATFPFQVAT